MHEYYQKKSKALKKTMNSFLKLIRPELEADLKMSYDEILEETWDIYYHKYMENFPYIGGDKVSGTGNLTGAYCYIALGDAVRKHGMSLERWGELTTICYRRFSDKIPAFARKLVKIVFNHPKFVGKMLKKKDAKNATNSSLNPGSFVTETQPNPTKDLIEFHNIVCPLANFAIKMNCTEYMPYICNLDYVMAESFQISFTRTKTCASGDEYCNFCLSATGKITPSWPCHSLNPDDPLK